MSMTKILHLAAWCKFSDLYMFVEFIDVVRLALKTALACLLVSLHMMYKLRKWNTTRTHAEGMNLAKNLRANDLTSSPLIRLQFFLLLHLNSELSFLLMSEQLRTGIVNKTKKRTQNSVKLKETMNFFNFLNLTILSIFFKIFEFFKVNKLDILK